MTEDEIMERLNQLLPPKNTEPKCTCRDDMKQRPLCPVCDKEKYDKYILSSEELKQNKTNG